MSETLLERTLRRDRWITGAALFALTALAWAYMLSLSTPDDMAGMDMGGMDMAAMAPQPAAPGDGAQFAFLFTMWAVMMVGMMTPSATPTILLYARVARTAGAEGKVFASAFWFALGYLLAWIGFALLAAAAQTLLDRAALLTPMMQLALPRIGAAVLIAAGVYQWTPLKRQCLIRCRAPLAFVQAHGGFKPQARASVRLGLLHGLYCIGCCWALMALLFVAGVMNPLWIAALALLVLAEKALPWGFLVARLAGLGFVTAGAWMLATA